MGIPANIVIIWSGAIIDIPDGWFLCDGQNGTPNLLNRFVVGSGNLYALDSTGGNKDAILVSHNHANASTNTTGSHNHSVSFTDFTGSLGGNLVGATSAQAQQGTMGTSSSGSHTHTVNVNTVGESGTDKNLPPYLALAYIMYGGD